MLSDGAAFAAAWGGGGEMGDLFEWPNFEFCGFGDLGLLTPVMGQGQGGSPELDPSWTATVPTQANAAAPQLSESIDGLLAMNQMDAAMMSAPPPQGVTQAQEKPRSDNDSGKSSPANDSVSLLQTFSFYHYHTCPCRQSRLLLGNGIPLF